MTNNQIITPPLSLTGGCQTKQGAERDSSFELLRLLSMFLILALHANHQSLGEPTAAATIANPLQMFTREFFQQICEIGVNVFVLISGWFGIRPKKSSFFNLLFQIAFYSVGLYALMYVLGGRLPILQTVKIFWFGAGYWFVPAYIVLYVLSPVVNAFIEHSDRKTIGIFLTSFFSVELLYGWAFDDYANFDGGYSAISFIGLYVLARYLKIHQPSITRWSIKKMMIWFMIICVFGTVFTFGSLLSGIPFLAEHVFGKMHIYTSPFVIIPSVLLVLVFSKIHFQSSAVNWLASSCFSIYLIHQHLMVRPFYTSECRHIFDNYSGLLYFGIIILFLLIVALISILVDKIRMLCWSGLKMKIFSNLD